MVLQIVEKKLEIPTKYEWKSAFDTIRKMHLKNNGSRVNYPYPRRASNSWEGSFTMLLWLYLFH